jgi:hypothetical protein
MTPAEVLDDHVRAFNARDLDALMDLFTPTAEWITGESKIVGEDELREFFAATFTSLLPTLEIRTVIQAPGMVACEIIERLRHNGRSQVFGIAGFYTIVDDKIAAAKIYREGSSDLE